MDKILWSNEFSVGVEILDKQHKVLVDMLNKVIEMPVVDSNSAVVTELLDGMIKYATTHFVTEERLMRLHNCPEFTVQKRQHLDFIAKTAEFCKVEEGDMVVQEFSNEVLIYLREWWINHILIDDMKYKTFFTDRNVF